MHYVTVLDHVVFTLHIKFAGIAYGSLGAQLNVKINAAGLADRAAAERLCAEAAEIAAKAVAEEAEVLAIVNSKIQ